MGSRTFLFVSVTVTKCCKFATDLHTMDCEQRARLQKRELDAIGCGFNAQCLGGTNGANRTDKTLARLIRASERTEFNSDP